MNTSHCRRGTISPGTPQWMCAFIHICECVCVRKKGGGVVQGLWVFPVVLLLTWSSKNNKTTWLHMTSRCYRGSTSQFTLFLERQSWGVKRVLQLTYLHPSAPFQTWEYIWELNGWSQPYTENVEMLALICTLFCFGLHIRAQCNTMNSRS